MKKVEEIKTRTVKSNSASNQKKSSKTPKVAKDVKKKRKSWLKPKEKRGLVYLSHIPHGFYEDQIKGYFTQFGKVTNVSVPRSKTGRSRGYAFIEFQHPEVGEIAAETMNNYLMFNRLLKAKYIPPNDQKPRLFLKASRAEVTNNTIPKNAIKLRNKNKLMKNKQLGEEAEVKLMKKLLKKKEVMSKNLEKLGVDYKFEVQKGNIDSLLKTKKELLKKHKEEKKKKKTTKKVAAISKTIKKNSILEKEEGSLKNDEDVVDEQKKTTEKVAAISKTIKKNSILEKKYSLKNDEDVVDENHAEVELRSTPNVQKLVVSKRKNRKCN